MIDWHELLVALPLALPEVLASAAAVTLTVRHRREPAALSWVLVPVAALGFSAAVRFIPIFMTPVRDWVDDALGGSPGGLMAVWYGDMILRLLAWAGLLYALFWRLPRRDPAALPPLDPEARQAAATAALLAVFLSQTQASP